MLWGRSTTLRPRGVAAPADQKPEQWTSPEHEASELGKNYGAKFWEKHGNGLGARRTS